MQKILTIAKREYLAGVKSKAFIVSLVLMPVMMGASFGIQVLSRKLEDNKEKVYALVDRTPGAKIAEALHSDIEFYNQVFIIDSKTGERKHPMLKLEVVPPSANTPEAMALQRYELSQRVAKDELEAFLEIGADVHQLKTKPSGDDSQTIRLQTKKPHEGFLGRYLDRRINEAIQRDRFAREKVDIGKVRQLQQEVPLIAMGLTTQNAVTGEYEDSTDSKTMGNFFLPMILIGLMFAVVMFGATPAMQGIVEEKSQRIAEVLLGSVTPFQLMAGKLLGLVSISMTTATIYFAGGYYLAMKSDLTSNLTPSLIFWFFVFLNLALLIFGSLFIAVGAAAQDIKDTQTLLTPVMLFIAMPMFMLGPIVMDPHGKIAVICSLIPTSAPMVLVARESVPPGVPLWQMITGVSIVIVTTIFCIWAAGRIFRIGFLMQGKSAKFKDMIRWVLRG